MPTRPGLCVCILFLMCASCSPYMASKQPGLKNTGLFATGTPRSELIAEFGTPTSSEAREDGRHDIFRFRQGYSSGAKAGRAIMHGVFDVFTLGLWEVVGTPIESAADGKDMAYEVVYDPDDRVKQIIPMTREQTGKTAGS